MKYDWNVFRKLKKYIFQTHKCLYSHQDQLTDRRTDRHCHSWSHTTGIGIILKITMFNDTFYTHSSFKANTEGEKT